MVIGSFHVRTFLIPVIDSFKVVMTDRTIVLELFPVFRRSIISHPA